MNSFLDEVADRVCAKFGEDLSEYTFVLPGQRAYQILRNKISSRINKVCWEAEFTTLTDLMSEYAHLESANEIVLAAKLYKICKDQLGSLIEDDFGSFASWGEVLIQDFSGIDCGMVDAKELFENVTDLKKLDETFDSKDVNRASEFILEKHVHPKNADYRENFDKLWKYLFTIYGLFKEDLFEAGIGYTGMICREAASKALLDENPKKKYIFVGFNTFNKAERTFIKALKPAAVYWDEYHFFGTANEVTGDVDSKLNPDGSNIEKIGCSCEESIKTDSSHQRAIEVISCSTDIMQCKVVRDMLSKTTEKIDNNTAIVLAEDALLPVMLQSLPDNIQEVNVTTGQPIADSIPYIYFKALKNIALKRINNFYPREEIEFILDYPYLKQRWADNASVKELREILKKNLAPAIELSEVNDSSFKEIFKEVTTANIGTYLIDRLSDLASAIADNEVTETVARMCRSIEAISYIVKAYDIPVTNLLFINMVEKHFARKYTPYVTDSTSGLQITGILETRCQDFKNIFILSADDDTLPKKSHLLSFIPSTIRMHYKLPMSGDFQRMSASYFYHLIMRAEKVHILYNSSANDSRSGEVSRFVQQIKYLKPQNTTLTYTTATSELKADNGETKLYCSDKVNDALSKRKISASMINTYLTCKKRFALTYVYGLKAPEVVTNEFRTSDIGSAVHKALEELCKKDYSKQRAQYLLDNFSIVEKIIEDNAFKMIRDTYPHMVDNGNMDRVKKLITSQVKGVLEYDAKNRDFKTIGTEQEVDWVEGFTMKIDRLDKMSNGTYRIVDYKSGKKEKLQLRNLRSKSDTKEKIDAIFSEGSNRYKNNDPVLQTLLYGLAYRDMEIMPAVYSLPLISNTDFSPYLDGIEEPIPNDYRKAFEDKLYETVEEMKCTDPTKEYGETKKSGDLYGSPCLLCDFRIFCGH